MFLGKKCKVRWPNNDLFVNFKLEIEIIGALKVWIEG